MGNKLEQLLNSLIEKGWKPFGFEAKEYKISIFNIRSITLQLYHTKHPTQEWIGYSIRNITSKESWLWQFVCENGMISKHIEKICINPYNNDGRLKHEEYDYKDYQYWIMICSLKDESELENFLLQNIKIDEK